MSKLKIHYFFVKKVIIRVTKYSWDICRRRINFNKCVYPQYWGLFLDTRYLFILHCPSSIHPLNRVTNACLSFYAWWPIQVAIRCNTNRSELNAIVQSSTITLCSWSVHVVLHWLQRMDGWCVVVFCIRYLWIVFQLSRTHWYHDAPTSGKRVPVLDTGLNETKDIDSWIHFIFKSSLLLIGGLWIILNWLIIITEV